MLVHLMTGVTIDRYYSSTGTSEISMSTRRKGNSTIEDNYAFDDTGNYY